MRANAPIANKEVELKLQLPARNLSKLRNSPLLRALKGAPTYNRGLRLFRYRQAQALQQESDVAGAPDRRSIRSDDQGDD
jgi:hypothetical protein